MLKEKKHQYLIVKYPPNMLGSLNIYMNECFSFFSLYLSNFHIFFKAQFKALCQEAFLV